MFALHKCSKIYLNSISFKMPKKFDPEVDHQVRAFSSAGLSYRAIVEKVRESGFDISLSGVFNIVNCIGYRRNDKLVGLPSPKKSHPTVVRTKELIGKIDKMTDKENPLSQRQMAKRLGVSVHTVSKVIHQDLKKKIKRKRLVHALKPSHIENRRRNCIKLYKNHLAGQRSEFAVTMDEAWFYLENCKGSRRIYYSSSKKTDPEYGVQKIEKFSEKFMVVGALTGRGPVPLVKVPGNVKVNSQYYIDEVLKPILEVHVAALYPGETEKVFIHHDKASSHTSKETARYAEDLRSRLGMTIITNSEIPVKSPDASPMDFYGFGMLKQRLFNRRATTIQGVWKLLQEEWNSITTEEVTKVYNSWKRRLRLVNKMNGHHIENVKTIHKRKVTL
jgi:[histone H3]-lysine36 N-dimethyltransferase SETMAR